MTKFLCGECIHNGDKGGGCLIPKNLGYVDNCNRYLPKERPIVQTNEEYLRSLNTEQLADILLHIADSCYWAGFFKGKEDDDCYDDEYCLINQNIVEWLKQPHKE